MFTIRKLTFCIGMLISIIVMSSFAFAQDASVRKELEALYAKRDKAIKDKDVAALRSTRTADFAVGSDFVLGDMPATLKSGEEAHAEAEKMLVDIDKSDASLSTTTNEVRSFNSKLVSVKQGKTQNEMIVETTEEGKMSVKWGIGDPVEMAWHAKSRDLCVRTESDWKIKRHEDLEHEMAAVK